MSQSETLHCPRCGALHELTPQYVAQFGGQTTQCGRCGAPFIVPSQLGQVPSPAMSSNPVAVLPYAGPARLNYLAGVWREGKLVVASKDAAFPDRCVKCNAPADGPPFRRSYWWHHPAIYLIILVQLLVYIIVALIVRQSGVVYVSLCQRHRQRRRTVITVGWIIVLSAIGAIVTGSVLVSDRAGDWAALIIVLGIFVVIAGFIVVIIGARILTPTRIDKQFLWLRGAGPDFLASIPGVRDAGASTTPPAQFSQ